MSDANWIQQELQQKRPFRSKTVAAGAAILRTGDMLRRHLETVLEPYGITWQQYNVLRILRGAGAEGLPTLSIGERMIEQTPGVTRLVDRLVAKGLVVRARGTFDLRQIICRLTPEGLALPERTNQPTDEADDFMLSALTEQQLDTLIDLLGRICRTFAARSPGTVDEAELPVDARDTRAG